MCDLCKKIDSICTLTPSSSHTKHLRRQDLRRLQPSRREHGSGSRHKRDGELKEGGGGVGLVDSVRVIGAQGVDMKVFQA